MAFRWAASRLVGCGIDCFGFVVEAFTISSWSEGNRDCSPALQTLIVKTSHSLIVTRFHPKFSGLLPADRLTVSPLRDKLFQTLTNTHSWLSESSSFTFVAPPIRSVTKSIRWRSAVPGLINFIYVNKILTARQL